MKSLFVTLLALTVGSAFAGEALFTPGTCTGSARTGRGPVKLRSPFRGMQSLPLKSRATAKRPGLPRRL